MSVNTFKYIHFAHYKDIPNWSVQYVVGEKLGFTKKYPMAKIGSFLKKSKAQIEIQDDAEYKQVTVKINNGGVIARNDGLLKKGSEIGTKRQTVVHAGQFIVSKIDARNGAFGVIPDDLEGAIVTNDFPVFDVDSSKILPQFMVLISTTPQFVGFARKCSSGTTNRKRIDIDAFLQQVIPLPSLDEQKAILKAYNEDLFEANQLLDEAMDKEQNINHYLDSMLKFSCNKSYIHKGLNFVSFRDASRWDVQYYSTRRNVLSAYDVKTIGQCLSAFMTDVNKASLRIETYKEPQKNFAYIGMESVEKNTGELLGLPIVKGMQIKSQTVRIPKGFFIYGKLRPYLNKYWVNETERENIVCSSEFFCFKPKAGIDIKYFKYVLSSYIIQDQISELVSGARMPRLNEESFKNVVIPIPPLGIQKQIADEISKRKEVIKSNKIIAKNMVSSALENFEQTIFE